MSHITTLIFKEDGNARCLYTDAIPLHQLGRVEIKRASTIEFNNDRQLWEVTMTGESFPRYSHPSREECLKWEREYLLQQQFNDTK